MTRGGSRATVNGRAVLVGRPGLLADADVNLSTLAWRVDRFQAISSVGRSSPQRNRSSAAKIVPG